MIPISTPTVVTDAWSNCSITRRDHDPDQAKHQPQRPEPAQLNAGLLECGPGLDPWRRRFHATSFVGIRTEGYVVAVGVRTARWPASAATTSSSPHTHASAPARPTTSASRPIAGGPVSKPA